MAFLGVMWEWEENVTSKLKWISRRLAAVDRRDSLLWLSLLSTPPAEAPRPKNVKALPFIQIT